MTLAYTNYYHLYIAFMQILIIIHHLNACVRYFYQIFIFSSNVRPSKTMKNVSYFIEKALFVFEIFNFL